MIRDLLINKTGEEKAQIKGAEIAKIKTVAKVKVGDYWIEILDTKETDGGVEVFVRAWDKNGQIGFGDGTVDIERFVIINPPILVDDPLGDIIREWTNYVTGKSEIRRLREDPQEAILRALSHTISIGGQKFDGSKVVKDKIGNTHTIFYPVAGANEPVDGHAGYNGQNVTWATIHAGTAANQSSDTSGVFNIIVRTANTSPNFSELWRSPVNFDTSSIDDGDTIDSATLSLHAGGSSAVLGGGVNITAYSGSTSAVTTASYNLSNYLDVKMSTDIAISAWDGANFNDFALNATGLSNIDKTGISQFGIRITYDIENTAPSHPGSSQYSYVQPKQADAAGTDTDPKLVVVHSVAAVAFTPRVMIF